MSSPGPIEGLRKKHALSDGTKASSVRSTVGIVFENTQVAMVVPGGPAFKPSKEGRRIEKGDTLEVKMRARSVTPQRVKGVTRWE